MLPDPGGMPVEWTHPFGTGHIRPCAHGPIVPILRFPVQGDVRPFPLEHVYSDKTQLLQQDNKADDPESVGELTLAGEDADGWVNRPSRKWQKNVTWRRTWEPIQPEGFPSPDGYHGTPASFLATPTPDGKCGCKIANPWTDPEEVLQEFPEYLRARFRRFGDACECETPLVLAVDSPATPSYACECETPSAVVVDQAGSVSTVCECDTPMSV